MKLELPIGVEVEINVCFSPLALKTPLVAKQRLRAISIDTLT